MNEDRREAHKEYVRQIVREMYPKANLDKDIFLILQFIIQSETYIPKSRGREDEKENLNVMIYIYENEGKNREDTWKAVYALPTFPFQNRDLAIAGIRYGVQPKRTDAKIIRNYGEYLLQLEGGKKISDIGIVLKIPSIAKLKTIKWVDVIWDVSGYSTASERYYIEKVESRKGANAYLLKTHTAVNWLYAEALQMDKDKYSYEEQSTGQPHHMFMHAVTLEPSVLGENMEIAQNSKKFRAWVKERENNRAHK